ncbi:hypothetical protein R1sor_026018 [Riccia sorocarpa]|uniref:Uncharacterized protein n=1 Tax=Riccia sorocarpa TaxID=122646 RepID=A0ABD3GDA1_9MARC
MAEAKTAKSAKSGKDRGTTVVQEAPKKKPSVPTQVTPPPPPRVLVTVKAQGTSEDEENISSDKDQGDATDSRSDSPVH